MPAATDTCTLHSHPLAFFFLSPFPHVQLHILHQTYTNHYLASFVHSSAMTGDNVSYDFMKLLAGVVLGTSLFLYAKLKLRSREHLAEQPSDSLFVPRAYTEEELAAYDGVTQPQAFVGVKGVIYSVSLEWYGPKGPYHAFAGCDSSRQLGKMKVGREERNADWTRLSPSHMQTLNEWEERLRSKYPAVGWLYDPERRLAERAKAFEP